MCSRTGQARLGRGWKDSVVLWGQGNLQGSPGRKRRARGLSSQEQGKGTQRLEGGGGPREGGGEGGPREDPGGPEVGVLGGRSKAA